MGENMSLPRNPSRAFIEANPHLYKTTSAKEQTRKAALVNPGGSGERCGATRFALRLTGQIRGGKNNMTVCRNGAHIPKPGWKIWRDAAVSEISRQLPHRWTPIAEPCCVRLEYFAGDKRRRDMPAIIDSIWHVLERAGFVKDDTLLWVSESVRHYSKETPGAIITLL